MKAAVFKGAGQLLQVQQVPDPAPGPDELVLRVHRCGICGTDLHRTEGHEGFTWPAGFVLGHEASGEVVALGADVKGFRIGDRVCALPFTGCGRCSMCHAGDPLFCKSGAKPMMGGFAEYMRAGFREAVKLPESLSMEDGALVEPLAVGLHAVEMSHLGPGSRVLVIGAGAVGLATLYWARRRGADRIAVLATSTRHEALAYEMGASQFLVSGENPTQPISAALAEEPDVVFEAVGLPGLISQAIDSVRPRGSVVVEGLCMHADSFKRAIALRKEVRLLFSVAYSKGEFEQVVAALEGGYTEPRSMITDTVTLDRLPEAFEALRRPSSQCKVMVRPWID